MALQPKEIAMIKKLIFLGTAAWALSRWMKLAGDSKTDRQKKAARKPDHIMDWEGEGGALRPQNPV
jgi:hypothetical protein